MTNKPKLNISGYRGIWGDTLTKEIAIAYTRAFFLFTKENKENPTILIGRDGRESGPEIKNIVIDELVKIGAQVVDGDILPTPTVLFSVKNHNYDGGIIITASHNPIEYNGLKFVNNKGLFTIKDEVEKINNYLEKEVDHKEGKLIEKENTPNFIKEHVDHIVKNINVELIRSKKFKIVADTINASASVLDPYLFEQLGVEYTILNGEPNGKFGHRPEPIKDNLLETEKVVRESNVDIGFVHDPDADRLVVINERGELNSEENTISLAIENILSKNKGRDIVLNLSTSKRGEDIATKYGSKCFRSKIGEGFVVDKMIEHDAIIGGEGNGGVIYPTINRARDSFVGIALILELMAERDKSISELISEIPEYFIKKDKWSVGGNLEEMYRKLKEIFTDAKTDEQDGIRFDFNDDSWIHLRPSNTEPIIRLFGEAKTEERINELFEEAKKVIL